MGESENERKIRVLVAIPGIDIHDRPSVNLTTALRDAGVEVIYLGRFQSPEMIVNSAIAEDVDAIALSYLANRLYMVYFSKVVELLKGRDAGHICVVAGGIIQERDKPALEKMGISGFFGPGSSMTEGVSHIIQRVKKRSMQGA